VDGPLAGPLLSNRVLPNGASVPLDGNIMKVAEAEFCFRFGQSLPKRGRPYCYNDFAHVGAPQLIADTACACWFVLGPATRADWRSRDLVTHAVTAFRNDQPAGSGSGANVLGDPRVAVTWLVNEICRYGDGIHKGQIVTTGTCVVPLAIAPGDRLRMDFGDFGTVEATIS
jgi:2-keto-4-pentenoate hydratase